MEPKQAGLVTLGAVAVALAVAVLVGDEKPLDTQRDVVLEPSKLGRARDGGKAYWVRVLAADGGLQIRRTAPDCVRRRAGSTVLSCRRRAEDGGIARDFGELNRFPASEAVGIGCEAVACSVTYGEDADADEDERLLLEAESPKARED